MRYATRKLSFCIIALDNASYELGVYKFKCPRVPG